MVARRAFLAGAAAMAAVPAAAVAKAKTRLRTVTTGLRFPEGPVALPDGSVLVSEIEAGRITRVGLDGRKTTVAMPGGGPNGLAFGPDGQLYSCNNGGFEWQRGEILLPTHRSDSYAGGRIDRIDPVSGRVFPLYTAVDAVPLGAPNDLVFDTHGGFWFTDHGSTTQKAHEFGGIFYARANGSAIKRVVGGMIGANGIALSPDGRTLYVAMTTERQLLAFDVKAPGILDPVAPLPGRVVTSLPGRGYLDSIKVEKGGNICLTRLVEGAVVVVNPRGQIVETLAIPDLIPTNLCFGGPANRTAWITGGTTGSLFRADWARPGMVPIYPANLG
jgi:gluconolactonase